MNINKLKELGVAMRNIVAAQKWDDDIGRATMTTVMEMFEPDEIYEDQTLVRWAELGGFVPANAIPEKCGKCGNPL